MTKMFSYIILLISSICVFTKAETFRFANHYSDHMVLQRQPHQAVIWGFGEDGAHVEISVKNIQTKGGVYHAIVKKGQFLISHTTFRTPWAYHGQTTLE